MALEAQSYDYRGQYMEFLVGCMASVLDGLALRRCPVVSNIQFKLNSRYWEAYTEVLFCLTIIFTVASLCLLQVPTYNQSRTLHLKTTPHLQYYRPQ